jgi:hypothetical protein
VSRHTGWDAVRLLPCACACASVCEQAKSSRHLAVWVMQLACSCGISSVTRLHAHDGREWRPVGIIALWPVSSAGACEHTGTSLLLLLT